MQLWFLNFISYFLGCIYAIRVSIFSLNKLYPLILEADFRLELLNEKLQFCTLFLESDSL